MPQPPPQAKPGLGAKLTAVALGASGGMSGIEKAIDYYQGVKNKPIADWDKQNAREATSNKAALETRNTESEIDLRSAQAEKDRTPPVQRPENPNQVYADAVQEAVNGGRDPRTDPKVLQIADTITSIQPERAPKAGDDKFMGVPLADIKKEIAANPAKYPGGYMDGAAGYQNQKTAAESLKAAEAAAGRDPQAAADRAERLTIAKTDAQTREETARDKAVHPYQSKVDSAQTAKDYLASGAFTGPSDEALMLQFFNAAKPETGFRLTQTEQDMLQNARSWFGGWEAKYLHATKGTYFSEDQRKQIVDTMTQMAARAQQNIEDYDAKHKGGGTSPAPAKSGATPAAPASTGAKPKTAEEYLKKFAPPAP